MKTKPTREMSLNANREKCIYKNESRKRGLWIIIIIIMSVMIMLTTMIIMHDTVILSYPCHFIWFLYLFCIWIIIINSIKIHTHIHTYSQFMCMFKLFEKLLKVIIKMFHYSQFPPLFFLYSCWNAQRRYVGIATRLCFKLEWRNWAPLHFWREKIMAQTNS